eukprot:s6135_g9.t1
MVEVLVLVLLLVLVLQHQHVVVLVLLLRLCIQLISTWLLAVTFKAAAFAGSTGTRNLRKIHEARSAMPLEHGDLMSGWGSDIVCSLRYAVIRR